MMTKKGNALAILGIVAAFSIVGLYFVLSSSQETPTGYFTGQGGSGFSPNVRADFFATIVHNGFTTEVNCAAVPAFLAQGDTLVDGSLCGIGPTPSPTDTPEPTATPEPTDEPTPTITPTVCIGEGCF